MTIELFRADSYLKECAATITATQEGAIILDQSVFYPTGGGQPGDSGTFELEDGTVITIANTVKDRETGTHLHLVEEGTPLPPVGTKLKAIINWERRYQLMRMHTALHIMCSKVDAAVSGGSIGLEKSRLDFDLPEAPDKEALAAAINEEIAANKPVEIAAISDEELEANPDLIRTMSVKPPTGQGSVRTIRVGDVDYQPCGGTHVKSTGEIGPIRIGKVEKKGKLNRRINIHFS
ncbi:Ser-tRNA(Ala) deacylase [Candidatus Terasakiella magnetica]|uniref:Alanine--tRNA ligase n=1 Tax=Candidatus Terasakiella magnetica TaxID=1867952 RepID=A0A1C3RKG1_9PROT|nr:alanyl-tRNA editing protein [Candidatus Terasakiella magnetica]SCA57804.1 Ser-tRNA(Ala) deacylase [Candidatus Terasakiella magnetica]